MKVHLIKKQSIEDFVSKNQSSTTSFERWIAIIQNVDWSELQDIKNTFNSADILGQSSERVIFNIGGNKYRMVCKYHFGKTNVHLFVKWIGTHAAYTRLCEHGKQHTINLY